MIIVDYRGPDKPRFAKISSRRDLSDCITWLLAVLDDMEINDRDADVIIDLKNYNGEGI